MGILAGMQNEDKRLVSGAARSNRAGVCAWWLCSWCFSHNKKKERLNLLRSRPRLRSRHFVFVGSRSLIRVITLALLLCLLAPRC